MSFLQDLRARLSSAKSTEQLLQEATAKQTAEQWSEAAALWQQVVERASDQMLGRLNHAICLYRLGRFVDAAPLAVWLTTHLEETHANTAAIIAILSFYGSGEYQHAAQMAAVLEKIVSDPIDLPGIPQYAFEGVLEERKSTPILIALRDIASKQLDPSMRGSVNALITRYEERERQMNP